MSETKFPKLIVQADPIHAGKHPYHDCRYITTDHKLEMIRDSEDDPVMQFAEGDGEEMIVAEMRDCERQAEFARLFAAAPELLEAAKEALALIESIYGEKPLACPNIYQLQTAIAKAEGRQS